MKHVSTAVSNSALNTITTSTNYGYAYALTQIAGGTDVGQRVGNNIAVQQINIRLEFGLAATGAAGTARVLVVLDHQPAASATAPELNTILEGVTNSTGSYSTTDILRLYNLNTVSHGMGPQRFRVLADRVVNVTQQAPTVTAPRRVLSLRIRPGGLKVAYSGSGNTTCVTNQMFLIIISDTNNLIVVGQHQICYFDS